MKKTLIIVAHPNIEESRINRAMLDEVSGISNVTVHDIYALYKSAQFIDVKKEQELLLAHDRIIFQFPLYWFSTPGLLKDWQDSVFERGFSHYSGGYKLAGKELKVAITVGLTEYGYQSGTYIGASISEILKPLEVTANFILMNFTPIFAIYDSLEITDEELQKQVKEYKNILFEDNWSELSSKNYKIKSSN